MIEASPLASDNDWVLRQAANHPIIVGMVGDLIPGTPAYEKDLDRLHANPLFLGIRYGNLWDRDLAVDAQKPGFLPGLKMLAERGLVLDSANPDLKLIRAIAGVSDHVPELRIVIDHLPTARVPSEAAARDEYWSLLRQLAKNKNVFVKLSEVIAARIEESGGPTFARNGSTPCGIFSAKTTFFMPAIGPIATIMQPTRRPSRLCAATSRPRAVWHRRSFSGRIPWLPTAGIHGRQINRRRTLHERRRQSRKPSALPGQEYARTGAGKRLRRIYRHLR